MMNDTKVGEYPLPNPYNSPSNTSPNLVADVTNPTTIGDGIGTEGATEDKGEIPTLPAPVDNGSGAANNTPATENRTTPAPKGNYPFGIPIPGNPNEIISPYDNQKVSILGKNGKPHPSGTKIRAKGETDKSRIFIVP